MNRFNLKFLLAGLFFSLLLGTSEVKAFAETTVSETGDTGSGQVEVCKDQNILPDQDTLIEGYLEKVLDDDSLFESAEESSETDNSSDAVSSQQSPDSEDVTSGSVDTDATASSNSTITYNNLSGQNAIIYKYLKEDIAKVAAGTKTLTKFQIPVTALLGTRTISEKKLGLTIYNETKKTWGNKTKIAQKAYGLLNFSTAKINYALQCDCPYELYWYDKTVGIILIKPSFTYSKDNGGELHFGKYVTVYMSVAEEFRSKTTANVYIYKQSSGDITYELQTAGSLMTAPKTAAKTAKALVAKYADYTDYKKLEAYKDYICDAVDYDDDAIYSNKDYGSSWQLVNVFDGDSSTNVVCEGYSKAFQYLCDLTDWDSDDILCYSVTGTVSAAGQSELHMWNIVHMPNGKNYLADITNSDADSIGENGDLFMAGTTSASTAITWVSYIAMDNVSVKYSYDEHARSLYTKAQRTMADKAYPCTNGHTVVKDAFVWATTSRNGKTAGKHCSACGEILKAQKIIYKPASISCSTLVYNGKQQKPTVKLKNANGNVINSKYYKVTFPKSVKAGIYKLTITFYGNAASTDSSEFSSYRYVGTMTKTYKIQPKSTSLSKVYAGKGKLSIYWKRMRTQTSGYQLQYSRNSKFTKNNKLITIGNTKTNHKVIKNLKRKVYYYVRIRTYKYVNGKKLVSSWSAKKKIKTK